MGHTRITAKNLVILSNEIDLKQGSKWMKSPIRKSYPDVPTLHLRNSVSYPSNFAIFFILKDSIISEEKIIFVLF